MGVGSGLGAGLAALLPETGELNECPNWDVRGQRLLWVDIPRRTVHEFDLSTGRHRAVETGHSISSFAPREAGGWVAAVERGFVCFDDAWTAVGTVTAAPGQGASTRFNDGHCDPWGSFWAGTTMTDDSGAAGAALYRFGPDGEVLPVLDGIIESNGIGWSPEGDTMYYVDSGAGTLDALAVDPGSGLPVSRETIVRVPSQKGVPDGLAVDVHGAVWLAVWDAACVCRFSPRGELLAQIDLPVDRPTSVAFGGRDLRQLYITTAREGLSSAQLERQPLAGAVFSLPVPVQGLPANVFRG
jgi:sugar lactone lactonase YvrE